MSSFSMLEVSWCEYKIQKLEIDGTNASPKNREA
jgi:hypothetical protein